MLEGIGLRMEGFTKTFPLAQGFSFPAKKMQYVEIKQ
jgi:hypothetical protein